MTAFGRFLPVKATQCAGRIRCKWVVKSMQLANEKAQAVNLFFVL